MDEPAQQLVFFDTFSHESPTDITLDLIQFPSPIRISEIRIIPLGARVTAKFPNGDRLGATNPSSFDVSFFVNDLALSSSHSTFTKLGSLSYKQNVNIALTLDEVTSRIPTDGLLIRGSYNTLTIAVIGRITDHESIRMQSEANLKAQAAIKDEPSTEPAAEVTKAVSPPKSSAGDGDQLGSLLEDLSNSPARSNLSIKGSLVSASPFEDVDSPGDIEINESIKSKADSDVVASDGAHQSTTESFVDTDLQEILSPEAECDDILNEELDSISDGELEPIPMELQDNDKTDETDPTCKVDESVEEVCKKQSDDVAEDLEQISSGDEEMFVKTCSQIEDDSSDPAIKGDDEDSSSFELTYFDPLKDPLVIDLNDKFDPCLSLVNENVTSDDTLSSILSVMRESFDDARERWADAVDLLMSKYNANQVEDHWSFLLDSVTNGLSNFESTFSVSHMSMSQVRQMKTSLKLVIFLLQAKSPLISEVTKNDKLWTSVLELYHQPHVSFPICLLVLSVVDTLTKSLIGIKFCISHTINYSQGSITLYQWILKQIIDQRSSRILFILERLLQRCNFYQLLVESTSYFTHSQQSDVHQVAQLIDHLIDQLKLTIAFARQPLNILPSTCVFSFKDDGEASLPLLFTWFQDVNLFDCLVKLSEQSRLKPLISQLLHVIATLPNGLTFMSTGSRSPATVNIVNNLMNQSSSYMQDDFKSNVIILAYCLHGNYLLKNLLLVDEHFERHLYQFHTFLSAPSCHSLSGLILLFSDDTNLTQLINLLWKPSAITNLIHQVVIDILVEVVRYRSSKVQNLLLNHYDNLITLSRRYHRSNSSREIAKWITNHHIPIEYNTGYFTSLCKAIKNEVDTIITSGRPSVSLITLLRITKQTCIDDTSIDLIEFDGLTRQLKYDYAIIELFSHDILQTFINLIDCLTNTLMYGYLKQCHSVNILTVLTFEATIPIIYQIISSLIRVRGKHFKDCTLIKPLLNVYTFIKSIDDARVKLLLNRVAKETVDLISLYTQLLPDFDATINVTTSLWSKTLGECVDFTLLAPRYFAPGLSVLNQLIPLSLPICVADSIDLNDPRDADLIHLLNMRKVWAVHVHPVSKKIEDMIMHLAVSSDEYVQHELAQLCNKLCDLSLPSALTVTQGIVNIFELIKEKSIPLIQWFKLLRTLSQSPSFKTAFLYIAFKTHSPVTSVSGAIKFTPESCFFHQIATWINSSNSVVLAICQNLTNVNIKLTMTYQTNEMNINNDDTSDETSNELQRIQETVNNLPPKESLVYLTHKLTQDAKCASVSCIKVLKTIATSDVGQSIVISTLNECTFVEDLLDEIAKNITNTITGDKICTDDDDDDETVNLLMSLISLLSMLWTQKIESRYIAKVQQISSLVKKWELEFTGTMNTYTCPDDSSTAPAAAAAAALSARGDLSSCSHINSSSSSSRNKCSKLIDRLLQQQVKVDKAVNTLTLPRPEPLSVIFQRRTLLIHSSDSEKSKCYHLDDIYSPTDTNEIQVITSTTSTTTSKTSVSSTCNTSHHLVNLIELASRLFPLKSFDLPSELASLLIKPTVTSKNDSIRSVKRSLLSSRVRETSTSHLSHHSSNHHHHSTSHPTLQTQTHQHQQLSHQHQGHHPLSSPFNQERLMVAPTRGRSSGPPGSKDPFRSRPPNTSRPPSMHVDDFVAMEQRGSSVTSTSLSSDLIRAQRGRNKDKRVRKPSHRGSSRDLSLPAARFISSRGTFPTH